MTDWPFDPPIIPMEAEVADELPPPPGWAYEPKWDGFRVVMWSGLTPRLDSRNAKPLLRYFPELVDALARLPAGTVADGEVVVQQHGRLDFDALLNRIHPAASRIERLSQQTPAQLALFDLLSLEGEDLRQRPFRERREALERLAAELAAAGSEEMSGTGLRRGKAAPKTAPEMAGAAAAPGAGSRQHGPTWLLTPSTTDVDVARRWFHDLESAGFDGIVVKPLDRPYAEGRREMIKVKHRRTVDCVVGGYRLHKDGKRVGSLLLGLYNREGELHFIGHCSSFSAREARELLEAVKPLERDGEHRGDAGFGRHARYPGGPSRWRAGGERGEEQDFVAVRPVLVVEVSYDQLTGDRFRHGTRFERWRPDKEPRDCTLDQLERPKGPALIEALRAARR